MQTMREMETAEARDKVRLAALYDEKIKAFMHDDYDQRQAHPTSYAQGLGNIFGGGLHEK